MKRLEAIVNIGESDSVEDAISSLELPFSVKKTDSGGEKCNEFAVFVPDEKLNDALSKISTAFDLRRKENVISVYDTFATLSPHLDRLRNDARDSHPAVSPLEAIVQPLNKFLKLDANRAYMIAIASVIALVGLWLNNVAIVIGAMLLSPLLGPINAASVNANLGRIKELLRAESVILGSIGISIGIAYVSTLVATQFTAFGLTEQISLRANVSLIDLLVAILLGVAGGIALIIALPEILVGVAVAVALLPPSVVTGIGLALPSQDIFSGALVLTIVNLVGLQAGAVLVLRLRGISPRKYYQKEKAKKYGLYSLALLLLFFTLLMGLVVLVRLGPA